MVFKLFELVVQLFKRIISFHVLGSNLPNPGAGAESITENVDVGALRVRGWWRLLALETEKAGPPASRKTVTYAAESAGGTSALLSREKLN